MLVGAGDIADCSTSGDEATAKLLESIPGTVFTAGDNAYPNGSAANFRDCYDPTWGGEKHRTKPSPGNHEYNTPGAAGYFNYFGAAAGDPSKGYYAYNLGDWRLYSLNSNCEEVGGCGATSPQIQWLKADLADHPRTCVGAYMHHPLISSGEHGNQPQVKPIWDALYAAGADVVIAGHDHSYERFAPKDPDGVADPERGIREFVVGTGGTSLRTFGTIKADSEVRNAVTHGVLKLTLHSKSYDWQFIPVEGKTFSDSGSDQCQGASDDAAPTVTSVAPTDGATNVAIGTNVEATFSEAMDAATIDDAQGDGNFTLTKGAQTVVANVSYDSATKKATLNPDVKLEAGVTYTATVKGGPSGVKDVAGNPLGTDEAWSFTTTLTPPTDTTPPETTIDSGPTGTVNRASASFGFSSWEAGSAFECSLDGAAFESCTSPKDYAGLLDGDHTFKVRAIDAAGNVDPTPAKRMWSVEACTITGTALNDVLEGAPGDDVICGFQGKDIIRGLRGNDTLLGNKGSDTIFGGNGNDTLRGSKGGDTIFGRDGNDTLRGSKGRDVLLGGGGEDHHYGGNHDDWLDSRDDISSNDKVIGGRAIDTCLADVGDKEGTSCEQ